MILSVDLVHLNNKKWIRWVISLFFKVFIFTTESQVVFEIILIKSGKGIWIEHWPFLSLSVRKNDRWFPFDILTHNFFLLCHPSLSWKKLIMYKYLSNNKILLWAMYFKEILGIGFKEVIIVSFNWSCVSDVLNATISAHYRLYLVWNPFI